VVVNGEDVSLVRLYLSTPDAPDWGDDALPAPALAPGQRVTVTFDGDCVADVRVVFPGAAEERRGVDVCALGVLVIRPGWTTAPVSQGEKL
jgi:hypothetical protein